MSYIRHQGSTRTTEITEGGSMPGYGLGLRRDDRLRECLIRLDEAEASLGAARQAIAEELMLPARSGQGGAGAGADLLGQTPERRQAQVSGSGTGAQPNEEDWLVDQVVADVLDDQVQKMREAGEAGVGMSALVRARRTGMKLPGHDHLVSVAVAVDAAKRSGCCRRFLSCLCKLLSCSCCCACLRRSSRAPRGQHSEDEYDDDVRSSCFLIMPDNRILMVWKLVGALFALYLAFSLPYCLAFDACHGSTAIICDGIMNVFFMFDVLINFFTVYKDDDTGVLVTSCGRIFKNYATGWLSIDLVSAIPWDWVAESGAGGDTSSYQMAKTVRLIRVSRVLRTLKVARVFRFQNLQSVKEKVSIVIEASPILMFFMGVARVLLLLFAMTHWSACAWYVIGTSPDKGPTWVKTHMPEGAEDFERYIYSVYFTLTTMTTVGYGDIVASNLHEVCFVLILLLQASIVFASLMGVLTDLIGTLNAQAKVEAERKRVLSQYMTWREVPKNLFLRVREHLMFKWAASDGNDSFEAEIKNQLSPVLKKELCYHIYGKTLRGVPFLSWMHEVALKDLANVVESIFMSKGDYVFRLGQTNQQIYILLQGTLRLSLNESLFENVEKTEEADHSSPSTKFFKVAKQVKSCQSGRGAFTRSLRLRHASASLRKKEAKESWAARFIQRFWRDTREVLKVDARSVLHRSGTGKSGVAFQSTTVSAPSFLGEACLWQPFDLWLDKAPKYRYSARCENRVEMVYIEREMLGKIVQRYSPWQLDRLVYFQECVRKEMKQSGVCMQPSDPKNTRFLGKDWDTDLHIPQDDHGFGATQCKVLLRVAAGTPPRGLTADHDDGFLPDSRPAQPPRHRSSQSSSNPLTQPLLR